MARATRATEALGIEHPIIQAPMAGGITTPRLVAAVSNAGALGSLGAAYMAPGAIREAVREIRGLTDKPFAVNLFVPEPFEEDPERVEHANSLMRRYREELGIEEPGSVAGYAEPFDEQLEAVLEEDVPVLSFTFGVPAAGQMQRLKAGGATVLGTATTTREARRLQAAGADLIVGQGAEAGGHRGTFMGDSLDATIGTMALVPQVADAVGVPVVASGGIMDGRGLAAALALGAEAVQMGTAFLTCEESGAHPEYKRAVLEATDEGTALTRAFSGKPARGIKNRFLVEMGEHEAEIPSYPVQNAWTRDIRGAARERDRPEFMSLWAGQAASLSRAATAAELVESLAERLE